MISNIEKIVEAAERIRAFVKETPVDHDKENNIFLKWENLQHTGSFKPRGVFNKVLSIKDNIHPRKLVAVSSGNHGLAVAYAAHLLNLDACIFMPQHASENKLAKIKKLNASVELTNTDFSKAEINAKNYATANDAAYLSPGSDLEIVVGMSTLALEFLKQIPSLKKLFVPAGGGGLLAGIGLAAKLINPNIRIIGVQSQASPYLHH